MGPSSSFEFEFWGTAADQLWEVRKLASLDLRKIAVEKEFLRAELRRFATTTPGAAYAKRIARRYAALRGLEVALTSGLIAAASVDVPPDAPPTDEPAPANQ